MRKLATIALLALSLFTVACTESEDADADFEAASIDELDGLAIDGEDDSLSQRAPSTAQPLTDTVDDGIERPAHAPNGEPLADRVGSTGLGTAPGQPGSGTAECFTPLKLSTGEPVVGAVSDDIGFRARERFNQMVKIRGLR